MKKASDIGLSEILIAFNYLSPESDETKVEILKLLGFAWTPTNPESTSSIDSRFSPSEQFASPEKEEGKSPIIEGPTTKLPTAAISLLPSYQLEPQFLEEVDFDAVELNDSKGLSVTKIDLHFEMPQYTPLLNQKWFQGIMSSMLSTQIQTRSIDFKLIEKSLSQFSPITEIPYLHRPTLNKGVQVLLDTSISMQPFWRDESELITSIYRLFNIHKTQVFEFELNLNPIPELIWDEGFSVRLQEEIPILLVTNFGATGSAGLNTIRECRALVQLLEQAKMKKCPVSALIPAEKKHYPKDLSSFIPFAFPWDSETSPQKVNKIKRK